MQALEIAEQYGLSGHSYVCMYRNSHTLYIGKHHPSSVSKAQFHFLVYLKVSEIGWKDSFFNKGC